MGMAAILFKGAEPFEQIVNILSTEGPNENCSSCFREETFKDFTNYTCI